MTKPRKAWLIAVVGAASVMAGLWLSLWRSGVPLSSEQLRQHIVMRLEQNLDARVDLASIELRFTPRLSITGQGLVIWHRRHPDVPLIAVDRFVVSSGFKSLWRRHIDAAELYGLAIQIPPPTKDVASTTEDRVVNSPDSRFREVVVDSLIADESTNQSHAE